MKIGKMQRKIEEHYNSQGVPIKVKCKSFMQKYDRYIFKITFKPGAKESLVFERASDIKTALQLPLFQPFREDLGIYLAVSEKDIRQNSLFEMLNSQEFRNSKERLPIAIGYDLIGRMVFDDLVKMPHALYAGSTNSGKSVGLINLVLSLVVKQPVRRCNLILFDIGADSLGVFEAVPHLSHRIVKDTDTGVYVIGKLVEEMERRINLDHDELVKEPAIVCVIDEQASFINGIQNKDQSGEIQNAISDILRRGRHGKIHMVFATQNPTIKNILVEISNVTARMAYKCAKYQNSIAILGVSGAEKLSGKGAMLYQSSEYPGPVYLQGAYMHPDEVKRIVERVKSAEHDMGNKFVIPELDFPGLLMQATAELGPKSSGRNGRKELVDIIIWTLKHDTISASQIMDKFKMGNRAYSIVEWLFEAGIVSDKNAKQPRKVIPQSFDDISEDVLKLLLNNGFSDEVIASTFHDREGGEFVI